jgi:hypothetical protein
MTFIKLGTCSCVPTDNPRPAIRTFKSKHIDFALDMKYLQILNKQLTGASLVSTLLTCFELFIQVDWSDDL